MNTPAEKPPYAEYIIKRERNPMNIKINLLGIGAVRIELEEFAIYIDAFNDRNAAPVVTNKDLLLFTHDDRDHFFDEALLKTYNDNVIVGPPSIVLPVWKSERIQRDHLKIFYPNEYGKPDKFCYNDVTISIFNTAHFLNWHNSHVSYLIEAGKKRIYVTGDSSIQDEDQERLRGVDCILYSLLDYEVVKELKSKKHGKYAHLTELLKVQKELSPALILGNHLINCSWAVDPGELRDFIKREDIDGIVIPVAAEEEFVI